MLSKEEILVQYLNRISYGNQAYGVEAAARLYFDKPSSVPAGLRIDPAGLCPFRKDHSGETDPVKTHFSCDLDGLLAKAPGHRRQERGGGIYLDIIGGVA
jgi:hypothetical protein